MNGVVKLVDVRGDVQGRTGDALQEPPLPVGDAYAYVLPEPDRDPEASATGVTAFDRRLMLTFAAAGTLVTVMVWLLFATIVAQPDAVSAATAHARIDLTFMLTP